MLFKRGALIFVGLALLVLSSYTPALAANFNLTTSPLPILLNTRPGTTVTTDLRVQNSGTDTASIKVSLRKFRANGTTGNPEILPRGTSDTYFDWVHFSQTSFTAQPGQWTTVKMTIDVPSTAAFGYYYAVIFSQDTGSTKPTASSPGSKISAGTAVLVLLNAQAPGEKQQLSAVSFSSAKKLYEYLPASFDVVVKNTGNVFTAPSGTIFIKKGKQVLAQLDLNPGNGNILPNSSRKFSASWGDGFPVFKPKLINGQVQTGKNGHQIMSLNWDFSKANHFRLGHYTAHLVLVYSNGNHDVPIQGDVSFWVIPYKAIIGLIILIIIAVYVWRWSVKRAVRKNMAKAKGTSK